MKTATVLWYNPDKGFGQGEMLDKRLVFIHKSNLPEDYKNGKRRLNRGMIIRFSMYERGSGFEAKDIEVL